MIASYGIVTGVDNSVTTVIAWRHILIAFRLVGPAARTRSQRRAGLNHARCTEISLQLAPRPQDVDIDAAIENILVNSGGLQQVFPRQQPPRRFEKGQQQRILAFAQRDRRRIGIEQSSATPFELPALESICTTRFAARTFCATPTDWPARMRVLPELTESASHRSRCRAWRHGWRDCARNADSFRITRSCNPFHFLPPQYGTEAGEQ